MQTYSATVLTYLEDLLKRLIKDVLVLNFEKSPLVEATGG